VRHLLRRPAVSRAGGHAAGNKSFLLLFSKKEVLPFFLSPLLDNRPDLP
jgi:hypothetical protein